MTPTPLQITSFIAHHGRIERRVRWQVVAALLINTAFWLTAAWVIVRIVG